jgi:acyl transferase domain-containing protein/thioesterase domain-containing protein/NAD(P)-dependent dehydrogenase (short-subunit alcohol dehydrogenase family)/acyl carrier protein
LHSNTAQSDEAPVNETDIAIVGMALRVPGSRNVDEFWANLRNGVESIRTVDSDELLANGEKPERIVRSDYVARTADLPDMEMFDADFFGLSPKEAAIMDPQHRQFLECAWEAMENAGRPPESMAGPVGVFAGSGMGSYFYFNVCSHRDLVDNVGMFLLRHTGNDKDFLATRASFLFDLHGPSVNVQTACSTSLVAVHYACQSLLGRECDMALAGGVTIELPHRRGYVYHDGEILSPDGHCRAFDHRAAGTVFGSGVGVVVLRRLADALADGDPIHAVIKATAINNDGGNKAGYLAPSVDGQAGAIVEAQALAGVDADSIGYVECHGTGTYLGDPIEIEALTQAFRQSTQRRAFCRVGSVKTNIGHLDTAAGVVSLIKAALAVRHGEIPPSLGFEKPNPSIDFANSPFVVNDRLTPWSNDRGPRRAGVNSLGVGGTNAHAVVEEPPRIAARVLATDASPQLLVFSARSRKALDQAGYRLADALDADPSLALSDAAYTLFAGRRHFDQRRIVAVRDRADAIDVLRRPELRRGHTHSKIAASGAVFMFPGGGSQHAGMARNLYHGDAAFRAAVDEGLSYLPRNLAAEIRELCFTDGSLPADASLRLLRPSLQLPAILIVEVAVARRWIREGLAPKALIGHSMGENAAACVAGVLSLDDAVNLVRLRGELFDTVPRGGMLSIPLSEQELRARLPDDLDLASVNGPELCVVSGPAERLAAFGALLGESGIDAQVVPIDIAAHSRMLEPILAQFEAFLRTLRLDAPRIPIVSNLTGTWLTETQARDPMYWVRHLRSTVRFSAGLKTLAEEAGRVFIEVGPGRTLCSLSKVQGFIDANQVINSLPHPEEPVADDVHLLGAFGRAWATGLDVPIGNAWPPQACRRVSLPTYPFQRQRYFLDRIETAPAQSADAPLMKVADIADWGYRPVWRQRAADIVHDADHSTATWLLFLDDAGVGEVMASRLRALGHSVAVVRCGDNYRRVDRGNFVLCPEHGRTGYDSLLADLTADGDLPSRVVHLWLLTGEESFRPGSSFFHRNIERGFYALFFLGKALASTDGVNALRITVIGNGFQRVGQESLPYPEKATVLGPALVLPKEMPGVEVRVVDIPFERMGRVPSTGFSAFFDRRPAGDGAVSEAAVSAVWDELFAEPGTEVVAIRQAKRWVQSQEKIRLEAPPDAASGLRDGGVYVVTGGLGDLALALSEALARRYRARFVLVARQDVPSPETWDSVLAGRASLRTRRLVEALRRIEEAGGEVLCVRGDVTNPLDVRSAFDAAEKRFGRIDGVLHAAGTVRDELIQMKQVSDVEDVLAPKVYGTSVLRDEMKGRGIGLFVLFSSTSTDTAPAGQVDYVAANCFLNAVAEADAARTDQRTLAVHWGVWNEVGLAARAVQAAQPSEPVSQDLTTPTPLFSRLGVTHDGGETVEGEWGPRTSWMLDDHRLSSGQAVLPGTGYLQAVAQALAARGWHGAYDISDVTFLQPLAVGDDAAAPVFVKFTPDGDEWTWSVSSQQQVGSRFGRVRHAEGRVSAVDGAAARRLDLAALSQRCGEAISAGAGSALRSVQETHLRFGPRWAVLRSIALGNREALASLELPAPFRHDLDEGFDLHPALLDIATGFAMQLIEGYDPQAALWVPFSYGRLRVFAPIPAKIWSWARMKGDGQNAAGLASFEVTILDEQGRVVAEVERFSVRKLGPANALSVAYSERDVETDAERKRGETSPAMARLAAQVSQGILPGEGADALVRALALACPQVVVSSLDLEALKQRTRPRAVDPEGQGADMFQRPDLDTEFVEPSNDIERKLAQFWSELLGVKTIGVHDSFFDLGGHSLIAVRLFRMIKKAYAIELPISVLFEAPTISQCAELIERAGGGSTAAEPAAGGEQPHAIAEVSPRFKHVVPMHPGKAAHRTPIFICAGMFGNILNLRHLAIRLGQDRPVYGLQAKGLYGGDTPHETFEEMARDYIAEVRAVQPYGPYILAGFSGGGIVAYEMAQQLTAQGEDVSYVFLLDTPLPHQPFKSLRDRLSIRYQDFQREGLALFPRWVAGKFRYRRVVREREMKDESAPDMLHNNMIEDYFIAALSLYRPRPYRGPVVLLRPKLQVHYVLPDGRRLNESRNVMMEDNGWSAYVTSLRVFEVPGDHDSMVLEPNVRSLAEHLRSIIRSTPTVPEEQAIAAE